MKEMIVGLLIALLVAVGAAVFLFLQSSPTSVVNMPSSAPVAATRPATQSKYSDGDFQLRTKRIAESKERVAFELELANVSTVHRYRNLRAGALVVDEHGNEFETSHDIIEEKDGTFTMDSWDFEMLPSSTHTFNFGCEPPMSVSTTFRVTVWLYEKTEYAPATERASFYFTVQLLPKS